MVLMRVPRRDSKLADAWIGPVEVVWKFDAVRVLAHSNMCATLN